MNTNADRILEVLVTLGPSCAHTLSVASGIPLPSTQSALGALKRRDAIEVVFDGPKGTRNIYRAAPYRLRKVPHGDHILRVLIAATEPLYTHEIARQCGLERVSSVTGSLWYLHRENVCTRTEMARRRVTWEITELGRLVAAPLVSGVQAVPFIRTISKGPQWVPQRDMVNFLSSMFMTPGHRA